MGNSDRGVVFPSTSGLILVDDCATEDEAGDPAGEKHRHGGRGEPCRDLVVSDGGAGEQRRILR